LPERTYWKLAIVVLKRTAEIAKKARIKAASAASCGEIMSFFPK
jgi:hypothetical protein